MYPHAESPPGMLLLRIDAPIYYANVEVRQRCGSLLLRIVWIASFI
jgi:hypothetical protein